MGEQQVPSAPPGWYADPDQIDTQRFWDGQQWTDQRAPAAAPAKSQTSSGAVFAGVFFALLAVIALVWVVHAIESSDDGLNCALENAERTMDGEPPLDCPDDTDF